MTIYEKFKLTPFIRIITPFVVGILVASLVSAPIWAVATLLSITYLAAWVLRNSTVAWFYISASLMMTGVLLTTLKTPKIVAPRNQKIVMAIEVTSNPVAQSIVGKGVVESGKVGTGRVGTDEGEDEDVKSTTPSRWIKASATIGRFRVDHSGKFRTAENSTYSESYGAKGDFGNDATIWLATNEKIELHIDTTYKIALGQQLLIAGYINPIDTLRSSYVALMQSRGIVGRIYLTPGNLITQVEAPHKSLAHYADRLQGTAVNRIMQLHISPEDRNMVATLTSGERRGMDRQLKNDYSKVGVAHILSVSGLHMGFVLILANIALFWLPSFHKGHIIKNVVVIILLWLYACSAGLSASVIRAALVMSAAQLALAFSVKGGGYNVILGVATIMLAINPLYLFDVSFQMSFISIFAIMFLYPRLYRRKFSRNKLLDFLYSTTAVGLAAQLGVMPIVIYNFGNIPLIAILVNPLVIFTSFITISMGLLWLIIPISILNSFISFVIEWVLWIQNSAVKLASATPIAAIENVTISQTLTVVIYLIMLLAAIGIVLCEQYDRGRKSQ